MLKILQITDLHILPTNEDRLMGVDTESSFREVLAHAYQTQSRFDLILVTGDLAQHPCKESYIRILNILQDYPSPGLCIPGNHDDFAIMQSILNTTSLNCQQHLLLRDWQIICLHSQKPDSPVGQLDDSQLKFLNDTLNAHPSISTILCMHHHCIGSGSPWMDTMQITNSEALLACLPQYSQLKIVCFGHIHQESAVYRQGIGFYSAPATCFQFKPGADVFTVANQAPGYRVFELYPDGNFTTACYWLPKVAPGLCFEGHY